jgi:hypothetical protein
MVVGDSCALFAAMFANVAVEGDACAHQSVPSFVKGTTKGDELALRANPDSGSKLFVRGVESLPGFGVLLFQVLTFCAEHRRQLDRLMAESFHADGKMNQDRLSWVGSVLTTVNEVLSRCAA